MRFGSENENQMVNIPCVVKIGPVPHKTPIFLDHVALNPIITIRFCGTFSFPLLYHGSSFWIDHADGTPLTIMMMMVMMIGFPLSSWVQPAPGEL